MAALYTVTDNIIDYYCQHYTLLMAALYTVTENILDYTENTEGGFWMQGNFS
jgi:hypothetical protein